MKATVGIFGISGVGKSTLIHRCALDVQFLHVQASELIKRGIARRAETPSAEQLRMGAVIDNQRLMIEEFRVQSLAASVDLIIFDGHTIIDTPSGVVAIPVSIFAELGLQRIVFIEDEPASIASRRELDQSRVRPRHSAEVLQQHQDIARTRARTIGAELGIRVSVVSAADAVAFRRALGSTDNLSN